MSDLSRAHNRAHFLIHNARSSHRNCRCAHCTVTGNKTRRSPRPQNRRGRHPHVSIAFGCVDGLFFCCELLQDLCASRRLSISTQLHDIVGAFRRHPFPLRRTSGVRCLIVGRVHLRPLPTLCIGTLARRSNLLSELERRPGSSWLIGGAPDVVCACF